MEKQTLFKTVIISNDIPIDLSIEEFKEIFTEKEIEDLQNDKEIKWADQDGEIHLVKMIK